MNRSLVHWQIIVILIYLTVPILAENSMLRIHLCPVVIGNDKGSTNAELLMDPESLLDQRGLRNDDDMHFKNDEDEL